MSERDEEVRFGFIGCGGFVTGNHLPNAHDNPKIEIYALCDLREDLLKKHAEKYHPKYTTTDMHKMCADPNIDAVVIGTREDFRVAPIKCAAEAGKHILVEKPMAIGEEDAREIVNIVNRAGVFLTVGFNRTYSQPIRDMRDVFQRIRGPETLMYYRLVAESQLWPKAYQVETAAGNANTIINEVTHIFDLLNFVTGHFPKAIFAAGGHSDNHAITLEYPDQTTCVILSGSCGTEAYPKECLEIFTNFTTLVSESFVEFNSAGVQDCGDKTYPIGRDPYKDFVDGEGITPLRLKRREWYANIPPEDRADGHYYFSRPSEDKGHYLELESLRKCIVTNTPPATTHVSGAIATLTALKAIESQKERRMIDLDWSEWTD